MQGVLVASDFDETLLVGGSILPGTAAAIARFRRSGGRFGVCSGRDEASLTRALARAEVEYDFMICLNGALVQAEGVPIAACALPPDFTRCLPLLQAVCVFFVIVAEGERVLWRGERYAPLWQEASMAEYLDEVTGGCTLCPSAEALHSPARQISCRLPNPAAARQLAADLCKMGFAAFPNGDYTDLTPTNTDKATGVEAARAHFHIPPGQVVTIGDGENDVPMLRRFCGFAMAHAPEGVRQQAAFTAASVSEVLERIQGGMPR